MADQQTAISYPNGAFMVYAPDKALGDISAICHSYNYKRPVEERARVVLVQVSVIAEGK